MIYDHQVKIDGVWYKAGVEVPALNTAKPIVNKVVEEPKTTAEPIEESKATSPVVKKAYNRKK